MRISIKRFDKEYVLLSLVIIVMTLFAYDKYNAKITLFLFYIIVNLGSIIVSLRNAKTYSMLIYMVLIYPFITVIISTIMSGGDFLSAIRAEYVNLFLLMVLIVLRKHVDIYKALYVALSIEVILILIIASLDMLGIVDLYMNPLTNLILDLNEGKISKSSYAMFYYVIFLNSSPLLIFHFTYSLLFKKYIWTVLSFVAVMFTGTRANIYIAMLSIPVYVFFVSKSKKKKICFVCICILVVMMGFGYMSEKISIINYAKSSGDLIRSHTVPSIINELNGNDWYWLFGMGHGSSYYSYGRDNFVVTSELSYLEMLRTVGLFGLIPFLVFILYPVKKIYFSKFRWLLLPYGALLVSSIVDPFLHTSTSYIMYVVVYYTYYEICRKSA